MNRIQEPTTNIYLNWLEKGQQAPLAASFEMAEMACRVLKNSYKKSIRALQNVNIEVNHVHDLMTSYGNLMSFFKHLNNQADVCVRLKRDSVKKLSNDFDSWFYAYNQNKFDSGLKNKLNTFSNGFKPNAPEVQWLSLFWESMADGSAEEASFEKEYNQIYENVQNEHTEYLAKNKDSLQFHFTQKPENFSVEAIKAGKSKASEKNMKGLLFELGSPEFHHLYDVDNAQIRKESWLMAENTPLSIENIDSARKAREKMFSCGENKGFFETITAKNLIQNPDNLIKPLEQGLKSLNKSTLTLQKYAKSKAFKKGVRIDEDFDTPWAFYRYRDYAEKGRKVSSDLEGIFPWRETSLKLISMLLKANGWTQLNKVETKGTGKWIQFSFLVEKNNKRFQIIYSPFRPKENGDSYSAGTAEIIQSSWLNGEHDGRCGLMRLEFGFDYNKGGYELDMDDVTYIAHEMGHIIHYMETNHNHPKVFNFIPDDFLEIPSHMMELFVKDSKVLTQLASKSGPAKAKKERFWIRKLSLKNGDALHLQNKILKSICDLKLSSSDDSIIKIVKETYQQAGMCFYDELNDWKSFFLWEIGYAGCDYQQTFPYGLVRFLIPMNQHEGTSSETVVAIFQSMMNEVIANPKVMNAESIKKSWKKWCGFTFEQAYAHGISSQIEDAKKKINKLIKA